MKSQDYDLSLSRVNLKLKTWKGNYIPGRHDVGRLQDENSKDIFQEQWNTKVGTRKI